MNTALRGSQDVPLGLLRRYLRAHDWRTPGVGTPWAQPVVSQQLSQIAASFMKGREGGKRDFEIYVLSDHGSDEIEITLTTDPSRHDFLRRIDGALDTLAAVEQRSPEEVAADIRSIGFDRVFSRIPDSLVVSDFDPARHSRAPHPRHATTARGDRYNRAFASAFLPKAIEYADNCRFGHTFKGSFGFTIELPLQANVNPTLPVVPEHAPFERRVMERFARGVQTIIRAADEGDTKPIVDSVEWGFSANACEQFAQLIEDTAPGGMSIGFAFSSEWRTSTELVRIPEFKVNLRHIEVTRAAAKTLMAKPVDRPETVTGLVVDLHARHDPLGLFGGSKSDETIVIAWRPGGNEEIRVTIPLSQLDYQKAVAAHTAGLPAKVTGTLEQRGPRTWVMTSVTAVSTGDETAP